MDHVPTALDHTHEIPPTKCPYCKKPHDRATNDCATHAPVEGDVALCLGCAGVSLYDAMLQLRAPTMPELCELKAQSQVWAEIQIARSAILQVNSNRKK